MSDQNQNIDEQLYRLYVDINEKIKDMEILFDLLIQYEDVFNSGDEITLEHFEKLREVMGKASEAGLGFCKQWIDLNQFNMAKLDVGLGDSKRIQ